MKKLAKGVVLIACTWLAGCDDGGGDEGTTTSDATTSSSSSSESASTSSASTSSNDDTSSTSTDCAVDLDPLALPLAGACALDRRLGGFRLEEQIDFAVVSGEVADGVPPLAVLTKVGTFGACELLQRPNPVCNPPCAADQACTLEETCIPFPRNQDLGLVEIDGMNQCLALTPAPLGLRYSAKDVPHRLFEPNHVVELRSPAGPYGPLLLHGVGVEPLELVGTGWTVVAGADTLVQWKAPTLSGPAFVDLKINVDQHGLSPASLYCHVPDTGQYTISAAAIDALYSKGVSGFPSATISRRTVDSQTLAGGCVDLSVGSLRVVKVCTQAGECK